MMTRRPRPGLTLFLALCVLGAVLFPSSPAHAQASRVLSVEVQGNQKISTDAILQVVATKPGEEFSKEQLDRDVREIHQMGWFRAQPATRVEETPDGVRVIFIVQEWPVIQKIEITGSSPTSLEDAIQHAISRASQTLRNMRWFEVVEVRGAIKDGKPTDWQVTLKIGFTLDE